MEQDPFWEAVIHSAGQENVQLHAAYSTITMFI
jgi:hypothetical protein